MGVILNRDTPKDLLVFTSYAMQHLSTVGEYKLYDHLGEHFFG